MSKLASSMLLLTLALLTSTMIPASELNAQPSVSLLDVKAPSVFPCNQPLPVYIKLKNNDPTAVRVLVVLQVSAYLSPYWYTSCYVYLPPLSVRSITLTVPCLAPGPNNLTVSVYYQTDLLDTTTLQVIGDYCPCTCCPPCYPPCCYPPCCPPCYPSYWCYYPCWYVRYTIDPPSEEPSPTPTPAESEEPTAEFKAYLAAVIAPSEVEVGEGFTIEVAVKVEGSLTGSLEVRALGEGFEFTPTLAKVALSGQTGRAKIYGKALSDKAHLLAVYLLHDRKPIDVQLMAVRAVSQQAQQAQAELAEVSSEEPTSSEASEEAPDLAQLEQPSEEAEESGLAASRISYMLKYSAEGAPMLALLIENMGSQPHTYVLECMSQVQQATVQPGVSTMMTVILPREGGIWKLTVDGELYSQGEVPAMPAGIQLPQGSQLSSPLRLRGVYYMITAAAALLSASLVALALALRRPAQASQ